ncbi:hypothetical protein SCHPADRAFT_947829, partial [Schizopora paradoxa]
HCIVSLRLTTTISSHIHIFDYSSVESAIKLFSKTSVDDEFIEGIKYAYPLFANSGADSADGSGSTVNPLSPSSSAPIRDEDQSMDVDLPNAANNLPDSDVDIELPDANPPVDESVLRTPTQAKKAPGRVKFKEPTVNESDESDSHELTDSEDESDFEKDDNPRRPTMPNPSSLSSPSLKIIARVGSGDKGAVQLAGGMWLKKYEYESLRKRVENKMLMEQFDIPASVRAVAGAARLKGPPPPPNLQRARILPLPRSQPARLSKTQTGSYVIPGLNDLDTPRGTVDLDKAVEKLLTIEDNDPFLDNYNPDLLSSPILPPRRLDNVDQDKQQSAHQAAPTATLPAAVDVEHGFSLPLPAAAPQQTVLPSSPTLATPTGESPALEREILPQDLGETGAAVQGRAPTPSMTVDVEMSPTHPAESRDVSTPLNKTLSAVPHLESDADLAAPALPGTPHEDESALSPREKAKHKTKTFPLTEVSEDDGSAARATGSLPLTDISTSTIPSHSRNVNRSKVDLKSVDPLTVPAGIEKLFVFLTAHLAGKDESELLLDWLALECEDEHIATTPRLLATNRPKAISAWLRSKTRSPDTPPPFVIDELSTELRSWWISLMPDWRIVGAGPEDITWPLSRRIPATETESWRKIKKAGPQGIGLVLYGLALWRTACLPGDSHHREHLSMIEDVAWVMNEMVKEHVPFMDRNRLPRLATAEIATAPAVPDPTLRTSSGRASIPTKRKLALEGEGAKRGRKPKN